MRLARRAKLQMWLIASKSKVYLPIFSMLRRREFNDRATSKVKKLAFSTKCSFQLNKVKIILTARCRKKLPHLRQLGPEEKSGWRALVEYRSPINALHPAPFAGRRCREATEVGRRMQHMILHYRAARFTSTEALPITISANPKAA